MGILDEVLAVTDNMRRVAARNVSDLVNDPKNAIAKTLYAGAETGQEQIKAVEAGDVSSLVPGGSSAAKMLGTFGGVGSKTFPHAKAVLYQRAVDRGMPAAKATEITGIWKGPDGQLRYEIPDTGMKLKGIPKADPKYTIDMYNLEHDELLKAYPQLESLIKKTKPVVDPDIPAPKGQYKGSAWNEPEISVTAPDIPSLRSTTAHELQHAIQRIEKFAKGGSPNMFVPETSAQLKAMGNFLPPQEAAKAEGLTPFEAYRRLAGEVEARAVEGRLQYSDMGVTPPVNPIDSYDVPFDKMLIRK